MNFSAELIKWYNYNKRPLPWRETRDPYLIWLSEIILQQTRVDQGMPYYLRFAERFPDVRSFAAASEDEILMLWQGLGYYSRGRNMLKTARKVVEEYSGRFPSSYNELIKLTGIGEYTAAAISSFSANEPKAVVDGNVYRLLSRYFGIYTPINTGAGKKEFQALADELLDKNNAGENNQAIIEFGALQCKPKNPNCFDCPLSSNCYAFLNNKTDSLPVKMKTLKIKERHFFYFVIIKDNKILIRRRDNSDIWAGLHDFPMIESERALLPEELLQHDIFNQWFPSAATIGKTSAPIKHILTHQRLFGTFIEIDSIKSHLIERNGWFWVEINKLEDYAKPKLILAFLKNFYKLKEI
ncbi:A/G-specific adenine glycosylase [Pseudopedobacter beijingensis]|uniref:Adenine DNA glycosylase n=1 Tax=Pseudopedobacter beijingensis TaxID=1207056 RepID=A0ABW4IBL2_9SPHI